MLTFFRNNKGSFMMKIILGIIVLVFTFWGVSSYDAIQVNILAEVNGEPIYLNEYSNEYESNYREFISQNPQAGEAELGLLRKRTLDGIVNRKLLINELKNWGFDPPKKAVAQEIFNNESFSNGGTFSKKLYLNFIENSRFSTEEYENLIRDGIVLQNFSNFIDSTASDSTDLIREQIKFLGKTVIGRAVEIGPNVMPEQQPAEAEIRGYYDNNLAAFLEEPSLDFEFILVGSENMLKNPKTTDRKIRRHYEETKETDYSTPPGFLSKHILVPVKENATVAEKRKAKAKADKLRAQVKRDPESFAEVAKKESGDPGSAAKGGALGWAGYGDFVPSYEATVKSMRPGELSEPVLSPFGYHIIFLEDLREASARPFNEVKEEIRAKLIAEKLRGLLSKLVEKINAGGEKARDLDYYAGKYSKTKETLNGFNSSTPMSFGNAAGLYSVIQGKNAGDFSAHKVSEDTAVLFRVIASNQPRQRSFEDVKDEAENVLKAELRNKAFEALLTKLTPKVADYGSLEELLAAEVPNAPEPTDIRFSLQDYYIPVIGASENIKASVFRQAEKTLALYQKNSGSSVLVFKIANGEKQTPDNIDLNQLKLAAASIKRQVIFQNIIASITSEADINYNSEELLRTGIEL